ncbi:MAG: dUTP diphosphatase [Polyangiaceae bacterium]|nr:dUTP diphosphatase [Polyangiaceae bacterium]
MSAVLPQTIRCKRTLPGDYPLPKHAKQGDAGLDLAMRRWRFPLSDVWLETSTTLAPGRRIVIDCGIAFELQPGTVGLVFPRSGLAQHWGVRPITGVVDSGFRGSVCPTLHNLGSTPIVLEVGQRIAQLVVVPCVCCELVAVDDLSTTERGETGFGSSDLRLVPSEAGGSAA